MAGALRPTRRAALGFVVAAELSPFAAAAQIAEPNYETARWSNQPAFPTGPLSADPVGRAFRAPKHPGVWPATPLLGPRGPQALSDWRGKTLLVALWAEWCAPCLAEMPGLARLNTRYGGRSFEILPIVTGSHTITSSAEANKRLAMLKGAEITSLVDGGDRGRTLMDTIAEVSPDAVSPPPTTKSPPGATVAATVLPCLVVIDPAGKVRGRVIWLPTINSKNPWETPAAETFVRLLAAGAVGS